MIRVNLLATTPGAAPKREILPKEQRGAMLGLGMLLVTGIVVGGWWWTVRNERVAVERTIAADETEIIHLKDVAKLVDRAAARKADLADRVGLIERLRTTQRGPVTLLETVSRSLSDGLWLSELKQTGLVTQIEGRAVSLTSITDFVEKLQDSNVFVRPVEIVTTTSETVEETPVVRFVVRATGIDPTKPAGADATTPGTPGGKPVAGAAAAKGM
jgi:Tfp pilus assembly protein PilN